MALDDKYPLALPQGTILAGQYVIEQALGQGGFGITYKAKDHKTGQSVAVKEFFPDSMASRTTQTMVTAFSGERGESFAYGKGCFLQEAETLAEFIGNENIVRVYSYFEENGTAYFVMEYIEGTSFDQYIKEHGGKVPYEEAERILLPVIDALALVHTKGIVHRDVTPDNIYITKDGRVKLLDFGAARYSLGDKSRSLDVVLKHGFAPKEQYTRHGRQGPYTDVYTVGASFYFAITGRRPPDSIDRIDEDELIPPSRLGVKIAPGKEDAILMAMSVQPSSRYQTMGEFHQALMGAAGTQAAQVQPGMPQAQEAAPQPVQQRVFTAPQPTPVQAQPIHIPQQVNIEPQPIHIPQQPQQANIEPQPIHIPQQPQPVPVPQAQPKKASTHLPMLVPVGYAVLTVVFFLINAVYDFYAFGFQYWFSLGAFSSAIMVLTALVLSVTISKDRGRRMIMLLETGIGLLLIVAVMLVFRCTDLYTIAFYYGVNFRSFKILFAFGILSAGCIVESGFFRAWGRKKSAALWQILAGVAMISLAILVKSIWGSY